METRKEKPPLILLYSETDGLLKILSEMFVKEGYNTSMTTDVGTVMSLLDTQKPDVFIIDVAEFGNNILQIIDLIRDQSDVPIIVLSTQNTPMMSQNVLAKDTSSFVAKPFRMRELLARVEAKIKRSGTD
ncbi:MAG: response regulator [Dehalococcoidales bacterium]|nr:response regulator [Dehalococcoidales bacterium]